VYIWQQLCQILTDFNNFWSAKAEKCTKQARIYLFLLKESVANDGINVSLFAYDKITLKTLTVNKRRQDIDKNVWESKKYGVKWLIKEFPNKKWSKHGVEDFQKRLQTTSIERAPGSGRPRTMHTAENVDAVGDLVQSQENQPQTQLHSTDLTRARNTSNK